MVIMADPIFTVRAPSNIALVKYMGKRDASSNLPENPSLSMTLDGLCSLAQIECRSSGDAGIRWVPELPLGTSSLSGFSAAPQVPDLSEAGAAKVTRHVSRVQKAVSEIFPAFGLVARDVPASQSWFVRTANTFPPASGIASSASSFAALTLVTAWACAEDPVDFEKRWKDSGDFRAALAQLSRLGSGSSCRSMDGPFVKWQDADVSVAKSAFHLPVPVPALAHFVLVVSSRAKAVSSSDAHVQVKTSPLWNGRVERACARVQELERALAAGDLTAIAKIAWSESWEMHSLFHTCAEPFSYWQPGTMVALQELSVALRESSPPVVTLDAGPNVHVIVEASKSAEWETRLNRIATAIGGGAFLLKDRPSQGATLISREVL